MLKRFALILGGYVLAFLAAIAAVEFNARFTSEQAKDASSGMFAFGDALLFVAVLVVASIPSTVAAVYFIVGSLRRRQQPPATM
jgi:hypothetical protein